MSQIFYSLCSSRSSYAETSNQTQHGGDGGGGNDDITEQETQRIIDSEGPCSTQKETSANDTRDATTWSYSIGAPERGRCWRERGKEPSMDGSTCANDRTCRPATGHVEARIKGRKMIIIVSADKRHGPRPPPRSCTVYDK